MKTFLIVAALVLVSTALISLLWFYLSFRSTPKAIWAARIRSRAAEWAARLARLDRGAEISPEEVKLREQFFQQHVKTIPVGAAMAYDGIGPKTVEQLSAAGFKNLGDMIGYDFMALPGFGDVRSKQMRDAVNALQAEARKRFDAGACSEAVEYHRRVSALEKAREIQVEAMRLESDALRRALESGKDLIELAGKVTFMNYLTNSGNVPGLDEIQLGRGLPEVDRENPTLPPAVIPVPPPVVVSGTKVAEPSGSGSTPFPPQASAIPVAPAGDLFERELGRGSASGPATPSANPGVAKLRAYCGFLLMIARADGRIAKAERAAVRAALGDHFGGDPILMRFIDPTLESMEQAVPGEADAISSLLAVSTPEERKALLAAAHRIADATGERNEREEDCIARVAAAFGIAPPTPVVVPVDAKPPSPAPSIQAADPRVVLEIDPAAPLSVELIRRRFTLLTDKADPAKAAALGPEFAQLAAEKRQAVRLAAETLLKPFGEPLDKPVSAAPTDLRDNPMLDDVFGA